MKILIALILITALLVWRLSPREDDDDDDDDDGAWLTD